MYNAEKEMQEAINAGERALNSLRDAEHYLGGARLWGIVDLFGGSGLSGIVKHVKISGKPSGIVCFFIYFDDI